MRSLLLPAQIVDLCRGCVSGNVFSRA